MKCVYLSEGFWFENVTQARSLLQSAVHQEDRSRLPGYRHGVRCWNPCKHAAVSVLENGPVWRWEIICCCDCISWKSPADCWRWQVTLSAAVSCSSHTLSSHINNVMCVFFAEMKADNRVFWLQTAPSRRWRPPAACGYWEVLGRWLTSSLDKRRPVWVEDLWGASTYTTTFSRCFPFVNDRKTTKLDFSSLDWQLRVSSWTFSLVHMKLQIQDSWWMIHQSASRIHGAKTPAAPHFTASNLLL